MAAASKDIFSVAVEEERLSLSFRAVVEARGYAPAREMIRRLFGMLGDRDGNFREQFQTTGFDARISELCLYAYLDEAGFTLDSRHDSPDFVVTKNGASLAIEATTANLSAADDPRDFSPETQDEILHHLTQQLPIKLGSPLFSKLQRRYWELPQVAGKPFLLAIESFAGGHSLWFADTSLASYLFGIWAVPWRLADGSLRVTDMPVHEHRHGEKQIPSGFFFAPETEHVSAVLFSNSATMAKLNRMAYQEGLERDAVYQMIRFGFAYDHGPNAAVPIPFRYTVGGDHKETWGEGISLIHNPNALIPVDEDLFPNACHHFFENGQAYAHVPPFHPFGTQTWTLARADE